MDVITPNNTRAQVGDLGRFISRWRPVDACLIQDSNGQFVLPSNHSSLAEQFFMAHKKNTLRNKFLMLALFLLLCVTYQLKPHLFSIESFVVLLGLISFSFVELQLSSLTLTSFRQKTEFAYNFNKFATRSFLVFGSIFFATLLFQLFAVESVGNLDELIMLIGNYYPEVNWLSSWRLLVGPFLHADVVHWSINWLLTTLFAAMVPTKSIRLILIIFLVGAVGSHVAAFLVHMVSNSTFDALLGASGGSYALLGFAISYYTMRKYFYVVTSLMFILVWGELSLMMTSNETSHVAHVGGLVIGILVHQLILILPAKDKTCTKAQHN